MAKYFDVTGVCRPSEHCMDRREWCMDYRSGKWAKEILDSRNEEGMWGNFHTLAQPVRNKAITTEQAIRRLRILGFTKEDEAVQAVLERMCLCVSGEKKIDDYYEKKLNLRKMKICIYWSQRKMGKRFPLCKWQ